MAHINIYDGIQDHPKTINLGVMMGWNIDETLGKLNRFWLWCTKHSLDGDLRPYSNSVLAGSVGLNQADADKFITAMVTCGGKRDGGPLPGFIDKEPFFSVHDWDDLQSDAVRLKKSRRMSDKRLTNVDSPHTVSSAVVLSFPVSGTTKDWPLTEQRLKDLQPLYPGVDILLEAKKALQWVKDNPSRRKTDRGMAKFLSGWFERSQNKSGFRNPEPRFDPVRAKQIDEAWSKKQEAYADRILSVKQAAAI